MVTDEQYLQKILQKLQKMCDKCVKIENMYVYIYIYVYYFVICVSVLFAFVICYY